MQITERQRKYWRSNLRLTAVLLGVWMAVTFVPIYWAQDLNRIALFGWPLAFYLGAQGALVIYVLVVWLYARCMDRLDREYAVEDTKDSP